MNNPDTEPDSFIPYLLDDLVEMCLEEGTLPDEEQQDFREFTSFFSAMGNFLSHQELDTLDKDYAYFNPDSEMKVRPCSLENLAEAGERVVNTFRNMAVNANYRKLTDEELEESFVAMSLIKFKTDVDLEEFAQVECYVRGSGFQPHVSRDWKFKETEQQVEIWRRVLLLMEFKKDEDLSEEQLIRRQKAKLPYQPGKIYIYQYKDVPKADLEILFPNVRVSMNRKDRILLGIPALVAAIGTAVKLGVKIVLVAGVIAWVFFGKEMFGVDASNKEMAMKAAVAFLGILAAFGGLGFKQYTSVKNKRIGFLKEVSEHLFFRNIAMNKAVLNRIIDDGEDEDSKEAILVYYHLLTHKGPALNRQQLDEKIQNWMKESFATVIDFDIDGPVNKLKKFAGVTNEGEKRYLLCEAPDGALSIPSLDEAKEIMDYHWDNAFQYSR
ncbi:MAG: TMEM143 family protein [Verrucomicrobiales bacterium]|nr:TMEM143 family protein [Verrucomicrobiales bacterium]